MLPMMHPQRDIYDPRLAEEEYWTLLLQTYSYIST